MVIVDQFALAISSIQQAILGVRRRIDGQQAPHDQIQDETQYDYVAPPPPVQLTVFHEPLVLHDQIEVACPPITVLVTATDDTCACMDRLEQRFRHMRIFDGVTGCDDIDVCAPHSPIA